MIRHSLVIVVLFLVCRFGFAQSPHIQWQKCYGGSLDDVAEYIVQTPDSGYIIAGSSGSHDYDVTTNYGGNDVRNVKINKVGNNVWQRSYGGSAYDRANYIQQTADGGYIVG